MFSVGPESFRDDEVLCFFTEPKNVCMAKWDRSRAEVDSLNEDSCKPGRSERFSVLLAILLTPEPCLSFTMSNAHFDLATWVTHVRMALGSFQELDELITNSEIRKHHLDRKYPLGDRLPGKGPISGPQLVRAATEGSLDSAQATYRRQMIVVAASYFEAIVSDFFKQLFLQHPQRMHSAIRPDSDAAKGMVLLREILAADSKEMLLDGLAETCSARLSSLPVQKIGKRLAELSTTGFGSKLEERLESLLNHRHRIVHENDNNAVLAQVVQSAFETIEQCTERLAHIAAEKDVGVRWSAVTA